MKKFVYFIILAIGIGFTSCETIDEPAIEYSPVFPLSGEWWVTCKINNADPLQLYYKKLFTYNTAANLSTEMWVNASNPEFSFLVKSATDIPNKSFTANAIANSNTGGAAAVKTVTIQNGKVIPNGAKSNSGVTVDSIYMEVILDDAALTSMGLPAGTTMVVSGQRRTGWLEDDF
jgi:hypothetical protein